MEPSGPPHKRAYAIGDIHGRLDLLRALLATIDADRHANPCAEDHIIFLGDLIDRGPESAGVVEYLMRARQFLPNPVFIMGNHEEMMLRALDHDPGELRGWLRHGGYECALSYGVETGRLAQLDAPAAARLIRRAIPDSHIAFLESCTDRFEFGDYLFVHAGIRPGVPVADQNIRDLRWIRDDFLNDTSRHPLFVVHGHTIREAPEERPNRIGIDTGAYASGILTALRIQGADRSFLSTGG